MLKCEVNGSRLKIFLGAQCSNKMTKSELEDFARAFDAPNIAHCVIDFDKVEKYDISFLVLLNAHISKLKSKKIIVEFIANSETSKSMLEFLGDINQVKKENALLPRVNPFKRFLARIGEGVCDYVMTFVDFVGFIGHALYATIASLLKPHKIRWHAVNYHIYNGVITAMPVICAVSFVVGGVIAYQGGVTLFRMGFSQGTVEMTAKLTLREIGPFVVALIAAGRSASSYTAQIGTMKMTEELDAMKTMNFNAATFIVVPRIIALVLSFPLMVFLSDLVSIFGCMVFLKYGFDITYGDYITQFKEFVGMNAFWVGMIKAPFYAMTIVVIGCFIGFRVEDSTQSVGEKTTTSVVHALFGVILVNALFSLIFTELRF